MLRKRRFPSATVVTFVAALASLSWASQSFADRGDVIIRNETGATLYVMGNTTVTGEVGPSSTVRFNRLVRSGIATVSIDAYKVRPKPNPIHRNFQVPDGPYEIVVTAADFGKSVMFDTPDNSSGNEASVTASGTFVGTWSVGWDGATSGSTTMKLETEHADCGSYDHRDGQMKGCARSGNTLKGQWTQNNANGGFEITLISADQWKGTWDDPEHGSEGEWGGTRIGN